ncbi:MAG: hypothetical protein E5Y55_28115 [Mesorhizobium sp.]|uniref:hypothetical protein n=1 Tax=Mesorhizobium sp. TaxID=1871066 RepID=UPI00122B3CC5|nr:hypothetical protein [Mesorhizobium sp.]TIL32463.1 MAG: hypothetical protein E5Y82_28585 [Mesorhizobium sp.]TIM40341.1 MAG: hypothetical protein E5Y55_28115 [Mesorhizobium sp.]TIS79552.1 MAG: hypothetical protein E5W94_04910 [Mesorhizobium sp.]
MNLAYVVRCNFGDASRETAWNDWYSGPKLAQMLRKPHFLTVQRFHRTSGIGRDYLAFWTLSSADAFSTIEYTSDWGFFEWKPYIIDWSRDLFATLSGASVLAPRLEDGQFLRLVSFEGLSDKIAEAKRGELDAVRPGTVWHKSVGLDRHSPLLGISVESSDQPLGAPGGVNEAIYRPISLLAITKRPEEFNLVR